MNTTLVGGARVEFPMRPVQRLLAEIVGHLTVNVFSRVCHKLQQHSFEQLDICTLLRIANNTYNFCSLDVALDVFY